MAEETKTEGKEAKTGEKEFIIPLRRKFIKTASYLRAPKAIRAIKEFLARHMKFYDRDLNKIRLEKHLNEFVWARGIKNPPARIKVRAFIDGDFVRVELAELPERLKFKKERLERRETKAAAAAPKEKAPEIPVAAEAPEKTEEKKEEEKEKKAAVVEAGKQLEKAAAKQAKHKTKISKQPKRQFRQALEK